MEKVSKIVKEQWLHPNIYPVLLVGRESRAFGNQAFLFSNSKYVHKTDSIVHCTNQLIELSTGSQFLASVSSSIQDDENLLLLDMQDLISNLTGLLNQLGPACGRIRQLVFGPGQASSFTQLRGAISQYREVLQIFHTQAGKSIQKKHSQYLESMYEGPSRQLEQTNQSQGFLRLQTLVDDYASRSGQLSKALTNFEEEILHCSKVYPAAYSVLLQRPSFTGSERFKLNELEEKPG